VFGGQLEGRVTEPELLCAYCGEAATTRDHVPPKNLFPTPRPSDLLTVPACAACNNRSSEDEEYFVNVLLAHHKASGSHADILLAQRLGRPAKPRRLRAAFRLLKGVRSVPIYTPAGIYLGDAPAFRADIGRMGTVLSKVARGLYYAEYGERMPADRVVHSMVDPNGGLTQHPVLQHVLRDGRGRSIGGDTFEYRMQRASDVPGTGLCIMLFWRRILVFSWLIRPETLAELGA
jgi:hypothetical protein